MKRKILSLVMAAAVTASLTAIPASAAFSDVPSGAWYAADVEEVQQYGIINGVGNNRFNPDGTLSVAEAVTMAARTDAANHGKTIAAAEGGNWYDPFVAYAVDQGILTTSETGVSLTAPCNRLTMATLFYRVFPDKSSKPVNTIDSLPDLKRDDATEGVFRLYEQGVLTGSDKAGSFHPDRTITRAETAAILNRVLNADKRRTFTLDPSAVVVTPAVPTQPTTPAQPAAPAGKVAAPQLKYKNATADTAKYYVQEGTVAPAAADVNKDGKMEIIASSNTVYCLDAASGKILWKAPSGHDATAPNADVFARATSDVIVQDIDKDGYDEIITVHTKYAATATSIVAVYDHTGRFQSGWPKTFNYAVNCVAVGDFEGDNWCEIAIGLGVGADQAPSVHVYEPDGSTRPGWPVVRGYGFFADTINFADLNADGKKELVALYDAEHTCAWNADGSPVKITSGLFSGLEWNSLPVAENYEWEQTLAKYATGHGGVVAGNSSSLIGGESAPRSKRNIIVGTVGGVVPADVDGNGSTELVYTAMIVDGLHLMDPAYGINTYKNIAKYYAPFILNTDRTRYVNTAKGFDWTQFPMDPAPIVTTESDQLPVTNMKPVAADLDRDGSMEILYTANDGQVHCWGLNGRQNGSWPCKLCAPGSGVKEFATRPVVADLNGDGYREVVFGTYTQNGQKNSHGSLYVLDCNGTVLSKTALPGYSYPNGAIQNPNGVKGSPVVADLDGDGKMEIAVHTTYSGVVVYDVG